MNYLYYSKITELRSCVKSRWLFWAPVPNKPTVSVDVKQHFNIIQNSTGYSELRSCVKAEVAVLGSPSLISLMVSVDIKHHERRKQKTRMTQSSSDV